MARNTRSIAPRTALKTYEAQVVQGAASRYVRVLAHDRQSATHAVVGELKSGEQIASFRQV